LIAAFLVLKASIAVFALFLPGRTKNSEIGVRIAAASRLSCWHWHWQQLAWESVILERRLNFYKARQQLRVRDACQVLGFQGIPDPRGKCTRRGSASSGCIPPPTNANREPPRFAS
jgi:hypothetical protein